MKIKLLLPVILLALTVFTACTVPPPKDIPLTGPEPVATAGTNDVTVQNVKAVEMGVWTEDYYISVGDILAIQFPYQSSYSTEMIVLPDGSISMMLIGRVVAAEKTPRMLAVELSARYAQLAEMNEESTRVQVRHKHYHIQPKDRLEIKFFFHPELNEEVVVRPDGRISLRLVNTIIAEGMTPEGLKSVLEKLYSEHISDPELVVIVRETYDDTFYMDGQKKRPVIPYLDVVNVVVRKYGQLQVYVGGEVKTPGFYDYGRPITAMQAIIAAGGNTDRAELRTVAIIRKGCDGKGMLYIRNLKSDRVGAGGMYGNPIETAANNDMILRPFDVVIVPMSQIAAVGKFIDQHLYSLIPNLRNIVNFGFVYDLNPEVQVRQ